MKYILNTLGVAILIGSLLGCGKNSATDEEIERKAQEKAAQLVAEQQKREELVAAEAARIAEERERLAQMAAEKREQIAADLSARAGVSDAKRQALLETAATEMARRDAAAADIKAFVDSLEILRSQMNEVTKLRINGDLAKEGMVLISPAGFSVVYKGQEGDYYLFEYSDDAFSVALKRTARSVSLASITHKKPLAEGIPAGTTQPSVLPSGSSVSAPSFTGGLSIMKATYGAGTVQRDVKDLEAIS